MPVLTYLNPLDREALLRILTEPKNALMKQYERIFALDGVQLTVEQPVLEFIVDTALKYNLGARGLRSICEAIMLDPMYDLPGSDAKEFVVTLEFAQEKVTRFTGTL
jgi:ATP-dependent Clp protease ATP-binding subunit ClpX